MSGKFVLKFGIAFGLLAALLVFLGVNYVPRISALSSAKENSVDAAKYVGSDYFERHPSANTSGSSANQLADNPELITVRRFEAESAKDTNSQRILSENPELILSNRFAADQAYSKEPLYKILAENPELILARRYAQEHNR
jgi:hypothetical protein